MPEQKFYVDINLNGNELKNAIAERVAALPTWNTAFIGRFLYLNTTDTLWYGNETEGAFTEVGANKIGPAEAGDNTYTDGLFTDFTPDTEIGTPIDRFNELFKSLVPPLAPALSDWSGAKSDDISANLSFDDSHPISTYISAESAGVAINETWSISGKRLGVVGEGGADITGTLNYQVAADSGSPTAAYEADSFGNANKGTLKLYVNGTVVDTADLTVDAAYDGTSGNTVSGLIISAAEYSYFPGGDELSAVDSKNRTGTYRVVGDDGDLENGYNYIEVKHDLDGGTTVITLTKFEFIQDIDLTDTTFSSDTLSTLSMAGSKKLSGVEYNTSGNALYNAIVSNAYRNTFNDDADGVSYVCSNTSIAHHAIPNIVTDYTDDFSITNKTANITSGIRLLDEGISVAARVKRSVQNTVNATSRSILNILMDDVAETSNIISSEAFNGETYRLLNSVDYDDPAEISSNSYVSSTSLVSNTELQVIGGKLIFPGKNSSYPSNFNGIVNGPSGNPDYSSLPSGSRTYYRYFRKTSSYTGTFIMNIAGTGGTFVSHSTSISATSNIHVDFKVPSETGWLDAYDDFATNEWDTGDGCRNATLGTGRAFSTNWGLSVGTKSTANSSGYVVLRITVSEGFTGSFDSITFTF